MASEHPTTLPARRALEHKQVALQSALHVLASGTALDRPDTPDEVVTAVRRLPAVEAAYAPFPGAPRPALARALKRAASAALLASGGSVRDGAGGTASRRHHADRIRQIALLQPAGARSRRELRRRARCICFQPRPSRRIRRRSSTSSTKSIGQLAAKAQAGGVTPTTATRRRMRAAPSASARTSCSPIPTCCTRAFSRIIRMGEAVREPAVHCDRRAPFLSRRLRQPLGQRPAPPALHLRALRIEAAIHCSSATIANPAELADPLAEKPFSLDRRRAARQQARSSSSSSIRRWSIASLAFAASTSTSRAASPASSAPQPAGYRLRSEPLVDGNPSDVSQRRFRRRPGHARPDSRLSRRLSSAARPRIEKGLRAGEFRGVVSTNALELGIDIGALDVCVMAGYPGTIA